jgi:hypothetical protein
MSKKKRQPLECVQEVPPACPKCGCTDRKKLDTVRKEEVFREREMSGKAPFNKQPFTMARWSRTTCLECGQHYKIIGYFRPADRTGGKDGLNQGKKKTRSEHGQLRIDSISNRSG